MNRIIRPPVKRTTVEEPHVDTSISGVRRKQNEIQINEPYVTEPYVTTNTASVVDNAPNENFLQVEHNEPQVGTTRVKEFTVSSSATHKIKDNYYKFECSQTIEVQGNVDIDHEMQKAFDSVNTAVDNQLEELRISLGL